MFKLNLVTPDRSLVIDKEAEEVSVPAYSGLLNVLPGHAPLMTTLEPGILRYRLKGQESQSVVISWGYCHISPEGVNVLAEMATTPEEINRGQSEELAKELEKKLAAEFLSDEQWNKVQHDLARARAEVSLKSH